MRTLALALALVLLGSAALASELPPNEPDQQRPWLVGHLVNDMNKLGVFTPEEQAKVSDMVNRLSDDEVGLLCQFYYLVRAQTVQDANVYASQQLGTEPAQPDPGLLPYLQTETVAAYDQLATISTPVQWLAQVCYASVPGWCCSAGVCLPPAYYDNGYYVGGCGNYGYCGDWAQPIYGCYHDHGSVFYGNYSRTDINNYYARTVARAARYNAYYARNNWHENLHHGNMHHGFYDGHHGQGGHAGQPHPTPYNHDQLASRLQQYQQKHGLNNDQLQQRIRQYQQKHPDSQLAQRLRDWQGNGQRTNSDPARRPQQQLAQRQQQRPNDMSQRLSQYQQKHGLTNDQLQQRLSQYRQKHPDSQLAQRLGGQQRPQVAQRQQQRPQQAQRAPQRPQQAQHAPQQRPRPQAQPRPQQRPQVAQRPQQARPQAQRPAPRPQPQQHASRPAPQRSAPAARPQPHQQANAGGGRARHK